MRLNFVLPVPRFVLHPLAAAAIAAVHVYLAYDHLSRLAVGQLEWIQIWKGFGALFGAYVFAALATAGCPRTSNKPSREQAAESVRIGVRI